MDSSTNHELIKLIKRYQFYIQQVDPPETDPQKILHYIRKLSKLPIKFEELDSTGIGKTINSLRKRNGNIAEEATSLVAKWKSIVKKQVEEEEALEKQYTDENNSQSDYDSPNEESQTNYVDYNNYENNRLENEKIANVDEEDKVKCSNKKSKHEKVHLITIKKEEISDRKRKHSNEEKEKHVKKEKCKKSRERTPEVSASEERNCKYSNVNVKQEVDELKIKKETDYSQDQDDRDSDTSKKGKKEKDNEKKTHKKDHEKRHHKTSKHSSHRDDKHHRHHSKSSHHDKRQGSEDKSISHKHRSDKKSKSRSKHETGNKASDNDRKSSKESSEMEWSDKKSNYKEVGSSYEDYTEKNEEHLGNDFGAVLLGISATSTSPKKKSISSKSSIYQDSPTFSSPKQNADFDILSSNIKLEPLSKDLDVLDVSYATKFDSPRDAFKSKLKSDSDGRKEEYSPPSHYSPKQKSAKIKMLSDEDMFSSMTTTKNQRTKVFSGCKVNSKTKFPTLFELCVRVLQDNFDALEYTGGVPYDVLKPILEKVSAEQLFSFENHNPYLIGETDELWKFHAKKHFRKAERQEYETWRDLYLRCVEEREEKLQSLTENISQSMANSTPVRKTQLAYLDTVVKPPRNVARSQAKHGTGYTMKKASKEPQPSPSAIQSVKERLAKDAASPFAVQIPSKSNMLVKKKKAPLMQKTLQLFKGLKR